MNEEILSFSTNWNNKLDCDVFSTIRLGSAKYFKGNKFKVVLKNETICQAKVVEVYWFKLAQLTDARAWLDTGYDKEKTTEIIRTMYKNTEVNVDEANFVYVLLQKIKPEQLKLI